MTHAVVPMPEYDEKGTLVCQGACGQLAGRCRCCPGCGLLARYSGGYCDECALAIRIDGDDLAMASDEERS